MVEAFEQLQLAQMCVGGLSCSPKVDKVAKSWKSALGCSGFVRRVGSWGATALLKRKALKHIRSLNEAVRGWIFRIRG